MRAKLPRRVYLECWAGAGRPRYYAARLQRAGEHWLVVRHWGFVGRPGWHLARAYGSEGDAERELRRLLRRREREGYHPAPDPPAGSPSPQLVMAWDGPEAALG